MEKYQPQVFIAPSPEAETLGQAMLMFAEIAKVNGLESILRENDLLEIDPEKWYPMQNALNVFKALYDDPNGPNYALVMMGMKAIQTLSFPPGVNTIAGALWLIQGIAREWARNVPEDFGFPVEIIDEGRARVTNNTPVPDSSVYGFIWNIVNNRKMPEQSFLVRVLPIDTGNRTVFEVLWGQTDEILSE